MDYGSLDTVIQKRERGYIWLEQRLKKNLAVTTLFVTACFLFIFILEILYGTGGQKEEFRIGFFSIFLLFMYVCIIHDTFYYVNNSNCYYY